MNPSRDRRHARTTPPVVLYRLNENINAIGAAVEELAIWVELQHGDTETSALVKASFKCWCGIQT